ncbi:hypothetical protein BDZ89DRAFT_1239284 [Hymenopellis radicata]|nr:hypothetical protein BDZ89DRAFT_1239284 [Hymenopellis radicata]
MSQTPHRCHNDYDSKSFAAFKAAITTNGTDSPPPPPPDAPCDHQILVSVDGKLEYGPWKHHRNIHHTVTFLFKPKNPPSPRAASRNRASVSSMAMCIDLMSLRVSNNAAQDKPIWGYCGQTNHCSSGKMFSIKAKEDIDKNFEALKALATKTGHASCRAISVENDTRTTNGVDNGAETGLSQDDVGRGQQLVATGMMMNATVTVEKAF